ncbi:MAG: hypothetical protein ACR2LT_07095 [Pyrinomonadaceae bacterium]
MKKTKIKDRIENAVDAFFDDKNLVENNSLIYSGGADSVQKNLSEVFVEKADILLKILKRVFLFFPGTFVLYNLVLLFTVFNVNPPIGSPALGYPNRLAIALLVSAFMTIFGLGNIRNWKHLIIPASIVLSAFISGVILSFLPDVIKNIDTYAIYSLPMALIMPILAKGLIDRTDKEKSGV